ncbi:MAG: DUF1343 domain-containing protein [Bacteroidales bacterium]
MNKTAVFILFISCCLAAAGCTNKKDITFAKVTVGAARTTEYISHLDGKSVAVVANQTSMVGNTHLVDTLLSLGVRIHHIFAPEHGFRDLVPAGDKVSDGFDSATGVRIVSLYSGHLKPLEEDLDSVDVVLFDIQDVGTRFYTYLSTMCLVMESCAENGVKMIILDRPNPNGFYFDGNILDTAFSSFVGMHPVPVVHGMTLGEYAMMVNGEGWLKGGVKCDLQVVKCADWKHSNYYELPVRPSPNLPNQNSIYLYPSTCFFEGTTLSLGRGTDFPFQVYGSPLYPDKGFSFTPDSNAAASHPPLRGKRCNGVDLRDALKDGLVPKPYINLDWIISAYNDYPVKDKFFTKYFDTLAGGTQLREMIQKGMTASQIRASWKEGLDKFSLVRNKYLLYD